MFQEFVKDVILDGGVSVLSLTSNEIGDVAQIAQNFNLDFADAYQYTLAVSANADLVSFDKDFSRTDLGCKVPSDIL